MSALDWSGRGFDVSKAAASPIARWAPDLQAVGYFERKGEGPNAFDCWGLASFVQSLIGRPTRSYAQLYSKADFSRPGAIDRLMRAEADAFVASEPGEVGDILVCARGGQEATHVAILCGAGFVLHAVERVGLLVTELHSRTRLTHVLDKRVVGCVRPA